MKAPIRNMAASVRARLSSLARVRNEDFQLVLERYAAERFLYRLSLSPHRDNFVLKGATLFSIWSNASYRATRDLDFTGYCDASIDKVKLTFQEILNINVEDDGLRFDARNIIIMPIREESEYGGVRANTNVYLGQAKISLQLDVGFGDAIIPAAEDVNYPVLLGGPLPRIRTYPKEVVVAEKFHAMIVNGMTNSRMKDFYDLYRIAKMFEFSGGRLSASITGTFARRKTILPPENSLPLSTALYTDSGKIKQWNIYVHNKSLPEVPAEFSIVGDCLRDFLAPLLKGLVNGNFNNYIWLPGGPWRSN